MGADRRLEQPAIPAHDGSGERRRDDREQDVRRRLIVANETPTQLATMMPRKYWPWPPMLNIPAAEREGHRQAGQDQCGRLEERLREVVRGQDWMSVVGWKIQLSPAPLKMSR